MIEQELKRMADAQERTANALETMLAYLKADKAEVSVARLAETTAAPAPAPAPKRGIKAEAAQVVQPVAPTPVPPPVAPVTPTAPVIVPTIVPTTAEELRMEAQKIAQKMGPKVLSFTQWVTNDLLKPLGVEKIVDVQPHQFGEVMAKMTAYAAQQGV
jgi:hypothetical protein